MDKAYFKEMTLHALTSEYLDWYAKLIEVPSSLTDKIHLILYRAYMKETGLDLWIKSKVSESPQIDYANNHLSQDCIIKISKFPEEKDVIIESTSEIQVSVPNKTHLYQPETDLCQYTIKHKMDSKKVLVITEAEKNRWTIRCFHKNLERNICFYHSEIESKENSRKYYKFLIDQERLVSKELLYHSMIKSGLSIAWLDNLMKE
ncbi:24913_t:CDS:2 [Cetraspora pellucida]|uniref:24913_t:CDS:1 n=1 Tax=Cetraspora pellucida TaxID=1433469 RepID=A0A9N9C8Q6_9GLOM|nr:24913_t:CDS:2 [Cetraspora pellucida]